MACTTAEEVKEIMIGCVLTTAQIDPFITIAHTYLNKVFLYDTTLSTAQRADIERWFTAHLITISGAYQGQTIKREKIGDAEVEYTVNQQMGSGLDATQFGQMAKLLDTSGLLFQSYKGSASIYAVKS